MLDEGSLEVWADGIQKHLDGTIKFHTKDIQDKLVDIEAQVIEAMLSSDKKFELLQRELIDIKDDIRWMKKIITQARESVNVRS